MGLPVFGMMMAPDDDPIPSLRIYIQERQHELSDFQDFFSNPVNLVDADEMINGLYGLIYQQHMQHLDIGRLGSGYRRLLQHPEIVDEWTALAEILEEAMEYVTTTIRSGNNGGRIPAYINHIDNRYENILDALNIIESDENP